MRALNAASILLVLTMLLALLFAGCGKKTPVLQPTIVREVQTVEVMVPVLVHRTPPAALLAPVTAPLPTFVAPADPKASSALTQEGERALLALIEDLLARIAAWQAWATETK